MVRRWIAGAALAAMGIATTAQAAQPILHPIQIGAETLRYDGDTPVLDLHGRHGAIQIAPVAAGHRMAFAIAAYNDADLPARFGPEMVSITADGVPIATMTAAEVGSQKTANLLTGALVATALLGAVALTGGAASAARTHIIAIAPPRAGVQPHDGGADDGPLNTQETVEHLLDRTRRRDAAQVLATSSLLKTGQMRAGSVIVRDGNLQPRQIGVEVRWNGETFRTAWRLVAKDTPPPVFVAAVREPSPPGEVRPATIHTTERPMVAGRDKAAETQVIPM